MSRMPGAVVERLRLAPAVLLGCTGALLLLSALTTTSTPYAVVLAAVAATIVAVVGARQLALTATAGRVGPTPGRSDEVAALGAARVTDAPRHPLLPRAPGLV